MALLAEIGPGEEILHDGEENWLVSLDEFREIGVDNGFNQHIEIGLGPVILFQLSGHTEDTLDRAHPEIVMRLLTQLLRGEFVEELDFAGKVSGLVDGLGIEHVFSNHGVVWNHHSHGTEQHFKVFRELGTSGVAGVEGDE